MNNEEKILSILERIEQKQEQFEQKQEQFEQKQDRFEQTQNALKADVARLNHDIEPKMNLILEGVTHLNERYAQFDRVEKITENHGHRIFALEQVVANK